MSEEKRIKNEKRKLEKDIAEAKSRISRLDDALVSICNKEGHIIVPSDSKHPLDSFATCERCEVDFGWWCPDSPDHICHYGEKEHKEFCIYCGESEERD